MLHQGQSDHLRDSATQQRKFLMRKSRFGILYESHKSTRLQFCAMWSRGKQIASGERGGKLGLRP